MSPNEVNHVENAMGYFARGLITNLLNPKAAIFYLAMLPTFVDATRPWLSQTLLLTVVNVGVATAVHVSIVLLASGLRPFLERPGRQRTLRRVLSIGLALIAVWFAWSTRRVM